MQGWPPSEMTRVRRRLLRWYRRKRRDLPWRRRGEDAYAQMVAELMLQQTQVATVIPYYERFMRSFPTVEALADAPRDLVLRHWSGLGYYRRAHALHDAARAVVSEHGGCFPRTVDGLMKLPGIGRYTAGAIASIAFGRRVPVLDGNVRRVLARLFEIDDPIGSSQLQPRLWELASSLLPARSCGDFNQALMELGATVCTPRQPACETCPLRESCRGHAHGRTASLPRVEPRRQPRAVELDLVIAMAETAVLVTNQRQDGLWRGMWTLPTGIADAGPTHELLPVGARRHHRRFTQLGEVSHTLTHRQLTLQVKLTRVRRTRLPRGFRWLPLDEARQVVPRAFVKALALLDETSRPG